MAKVDHKNENGNRNILLSDRESPIKNRGLSTSDDSRSLGVKLVKSFQSRCCLHEFLGIIKSVEEKEVVLTFVFSMD